MKEKKSDNKPDDNSKKISNLKNELKNEERLQRENMEHALKFGGGARTTYSLQQRGQKIRDLKKEIEDLEFPPKKLTVSDIDLSKIASSNGQYLRKQDLDMTPKKTLENMLKKVGEIEEDLLKKEPDLYSDERGGGPAWFYHIQNTLNRAIKDSK